ncbi:ribosome biogenesis protein UTP30 [Entomortierella parvispora]|uniref:Ribosomal L1 domain-containing protein 1 n=1 Tax=Entomortierella parvispora TaxID=205924 RepID=A0A9P3HI35_9FUNG|nr:ribosome biogenesis protein UTP30 [Entomortierella parvispora]
MLDIKQADKAVKALLGHVAKQGDSKSQLMEEDQTVWLIIATKKFSDASKAKPHRIPLKHSIVAPDAEVCLFVKDPQKDFKRLLEEKQVKAVNKVIGVSKLRAKYKPYEAKRQLCASYGMFLADARVITVLPKLLGKTFFLKKKQPIPVDMTKGDLKKEIARAIGSTYMHMNTGTCTAIKVGLTSQSAAEITANIETAMPHIIEKIPRKWKNVQAINLKTNDSIALPIFNSLPDDGLSRISNKANYPNAFDEDEEDEEDEDEDDE